MSSCLCTLRPAPRLADRLIPLPVQIVAIDAGIGDNSVSNVTRSTRLLFKPSSPTRPHVFKNVPSMPYVRCAVFLEVVVFSDVPDSRVLPGPPDPVAVFRLSTPGSAGSSPDV